MSRIRKIATGTGVVLAVAVVAAIAGFVAFVSAIPTVRDPAPPSADAIVVLTGAASRISDALELLNEGRARRLLITGVHPNTSRQAISDQEPEHARLFDCCVDIGRQAADTFGNASETSSWLRDKQFKSLIVVTSNYHMPRSLAEFSRAMPDVELIPYPVVTTHFTADHWWTYPGTLRLVLSEYVKFVAAKVRQHLGGPPSQAIAVSPEPPPLSRFRPAGREEAGDES